MENNNEKYEIEEDEQEKEGPVIIREKFENKYFDYFLDIFYKLEKEYPYIFKRSDLFVNFMFDIVFDETTVIKKELYTIVDEDIISTFYLINKYLKFFKKSVSLREWDEFCKNN